MIQLVHVQAFITVVRLNSYSAAAKALATTQPSVSRRISELERDLGVLLFDTRSRRAKLTPKGQEFLPLAEDLLLRVSQITSKMTSRQEISGTVRVGASETVAMTWLSSLVEATRRQFPKVVLSVDVDLADRLTAKFQAGLYDVAIITPATVNNDMKSVDLGCFDYVWMASPSLNIPKRVHSPIQLTDYPMISLSDESALYQMAVRWFKQHSANPTWVNHCGSVSMVTALTEAGLGVSLLPLSQLLQQVESKKLQVIEVVPPFPSLRFSAVYQTHTTAPATEAVVKLMRECTTFYFPENE